MSENILLIKLGAIGDVLRTTSLLHGIKEKYKDCYIVWLTKDSSKEVLLNNPLIDEIVTFDENTYLLLKKKNFDVIINLDEGKDVCELATSLEGEKIGFYLKDRRVIPTKTAVKWYNMSTLGEYPMNNILKKANKRTYQEIMFEIVDARPKNKELVFNLSKEEKIFAKNFFQKNNIKNGNLIIGVNTGAGNRWQYKKWGIENTAKLIDKLNNEFHASIILLGGPEEAERNEKIKQSVNTKLFDGGTNNTIREFAALIDLCGLIITSDSLAMHLAIALKKHVVAFFGPTSTAEIEIYGRGEKIEAPIECVCCYLTRCRKSPTCMDNLTVDIMFDAIKKVIEENFMPKN